MLISNIRSKHRPLLLGAAAAGGLFAGAAGASAQTLGPLVQITSTSIFSACTADHVASQPGTNFPNTVVEPNLAINPAATDNLLVSIQQDRWNNGGSRGLRTDASQNGGATFTNSSTPGVTQCQGGPWPRSSDPWVTFSPNGVAYESALVVKESADPHVLAAASGQTVSRSTDGGLTWGLPTTLIADFDKNSLDDKNSITADPGNSNFVYTVWDRLTQFVAGYGVADEGGESGGEEAPVAHAGMDGTDIAHALHDHALAVAAGKAKPHSRNLVIGPTYFSRTTDGGATWTLPKIIWNPGPNSQTIANQIVAEPSGNIRDYFTELQDNTNGQPGRIGSVASTDHGTSWSTPDYAQLLVNNKATTPNLLQPIRSADVLFSIAVDTTHKLTYLVWEDSRFTGDDETAFAWSPDGGFEWTAPVRINQTPRNSAGGSGFFQQAIIPTVGVVSDGTVVVTYYDFRNDPVGATYDNADFWAVSCNPTTSPDACLSNGDWSNEQRLTASSFNWDYAPLTSSGRFLGDYMSMKPVGQTMYTVFTQTVGPNLTDLYIRSLIFPTTTAAR